MPSRKETWNDPDIQLMLEAAGGRRDAFDRLAGKYQNILLNFFIRLGVYEDAEDLVQETLIRLYRARKRYRPKAKFSTYLFTLARNVWVDRVRKSGRYSDMKSRFESDPSRRPPDPAAAGGAIDAETLLSGLSDKLREVVVLNVYHGMGMNDIAKVLGIPEGTVKSRLHLAIRRMRDELKNDEERTR